MGRKGRSPLFTRLGSAVRWLDLRSSFVSVRDVFDAAFALLSRSGQRDEYVYKAALTQRILLGKHSLHTASMLSEFRIGDCKADLAILNGTSSVYEVKSERDSLTRLERQITAYRTVFAKVYAIAAENHVPDILSVVPDDVGVLQLDRRNYVSTVREAEKRPERTSPRAIFESLRTREAKLILESRGIRVPSVPNTELYSVLRQLFGELTPIEAHDSMVSVLKRTRDLRPLSELVDELPVSLQTAALLIPLRKSDHARLINAVDTPLRDAMAWA